MKMDESDCCKPNCYSCNFYYSSACLGPSYNWYNPVSKRRAEQILEGGKFPSFTVERRPLEKEEINGLTRLVQKLTVFQG